MKKLTDKQINFIKENHEEKVNEYIHYAVDNALIYNSDIEKYALRFSSITNLLDGVYTNFDLYKDVWQEIYEEEFEDIASEIYDELDEEEQQEINELEDKEGETCFY